MRLTPRRPAQGEVHDRYDRFIFTTARRTNRSLGVTGALVLIDDRFVQALEGEEAAVRDLYARITEDPRHDECTVLKEQVVNGRTFDRWAMGEIAARPVARGR